MWLRFPRWFFWIKNCFGLKREISVTAFTLLFLHIFTVVIFSYITNRHQLFPMFSVTISSAASVVVITSHSTTHYSHQLTPLMDVDANNCQIKNVSSFSSVLLVQIRWDRYSAAFTDVIEFYYYRYLLQNQHSM